MKNQSESIHWGSMDWFKNKICSQGTDDPAAYFSHAHNGYQYYRHRELLKELRISGLLEHKTDLRIGEIGCGTGELLELFRDQLNASSTVGVDFVAEAISVASSAYPHIHFSTGVLPDIPDNMKQMDLIIASEVLYYLSEADRQETLKRLHAALRPGGLLLFSSVLGKQYFDINSATTLIGQYFNISVSSYQYNRLYHTLVQPATIINSAKFRLYTGTQGLPNKRNDLLMKYHRLTRNPVVKFGILLLSKILSPTLRWKWLPALCSKIARFINSTRFQSNLVIIAQRVP